ncbi:MAG: ROK family protein [Phycisphaerales bacterium]
MPALGIDIGGSSVKACLLDAGAPRTSQSPPYTNPDRPRLITAIRSAIENLGPMEPIIAVGLCLPGRHNAGGDAIEVSVNLPCLNGWLFSELIGDALGYTPEQHCVVSDAYAAAHDWICGHGGRGRLAAVAIGTGVGLCVLDDGRPVGIGQRGIGHLGMTDVGRLGTHDTIGPDGASNTLESYIGLGALRRRFGDGRHEAIAERIAKLSIEDPFMLAIVRGLRIVHAIYTPDTVVMMGGVGITLRGRSQELYEAVSASLTTLARPGWRLEFGDSLHHAASGAARLTSVES